MSRNRVAALFLFSLFSVFAVQALPIDAAGPTPRVLKLSASLASDSLLHFEPGVVAITFSIYKEREDTAPLWTTTQNVAIDDAGRFTVLLGESEKDGIPMELFTSGEARWLGVQRIPERERERIMLASVPYALKAADAETLGGKPLSAFVLAEGSDTATAPGAKKLRPAVNGTAGFIAKFIDTTNIDNSVLFESAGRIGLSTTSPQGPLHINSVVTYRNGGVGSVQTGTNPGIMLENPATNSTVLLSESFGLVVFASTSATAPLSGSDLRFVIRPTGNVGIGISNPVAPLHIGTTQLYRSLNVAAVQRGTNPGLLLENPATNTSVALTENNGLSFYTTPSSSLPFVGSDLRMVLTTAGDVGIGTGAPPARLTVIGPSVVNNLPLPTTGANAPPVLRIIGGNGGDATVTGGIGSSVLIQSGNGGNAGQSTNFGGAGGNITLQTGIGGTGDVQGKPGNVVIANGDGYVSAAGQGIILRSPDGSVCRRLTIDNAGALQVGFAFCPP